ncbi:UNVERIFIED_ORG: hypothetical protein [Escherichia phage CMSTMSU]
MLVHTSQELNIQGVQYNSIPDAWAKQVIYASHVILVVY